MASIVTYVCLYLAAVLLWVPSFKRVALWVPALIISIVFGLLSHRVGFIGLLFMLILACATYSLKSSQKPFTRLLSAMVLFVLGLGLSLHWLPGFQNLRVLNNIQISPNGIPFSLYLNFDKTVVGLFIIGILHQRIMTRTQWKTLFTAIWLRALIVILVIAIVSFSFKFIGFDLKLPPSLPIWAVTNLLFVCLAEEGFYRGFIQKYLCVCLQKMTYGHLIAIGISAILFGLSHFMGGTKYVILATMAGVGYGWIYWRTQRIEGSIITHFLLNLTHFLFFTYPALANNALH